MIGNPRAITDWLVEWSHTTPMAPAVSAGETMLSYRELAGCADRTAAAMSSAGVRPGDRVIVAGVNTPAWVVVFLATMRLGAVVVPLNPRLSRRQLPEFVALAEPTLTFADGTVIEQFRKLDDQLCGTLVHIGHGSPTALLTWADSFDEKSARGDFVPPSLAAEDPALLAFTSGTTGPPKGALITHGALLASTESWLPHARVDQRSRTTVLVPLFHNTGYVDQVCLMLRSGGHTDLVAQFGKSAAVTAMVRRPPTFLCLVPSILRILMLHPDADRILGTCQAIGVGGASMPLAWAAELAGRWPGVQLLHAYGLTEFTSVSHLLPAQDVLQHGDSVGLPVLGATCSIRDAEGKEAPAGAVGEVWLSGPQRMVGYFRDPRGTAEALQGEWLRTGDLGFLDDRQYLRLHGRMGHTINRGGEKILAGPIEDALHGLPSVAHAVVVGLPDPILGESVAAAVVPRPGTDFDENDATAVLADSFPDYANPQKYVVLEEIPLSPTGKPDRQRVVELIVRQ